MKPKPRRYEWWLLIGTPSGWWDLWARYPTLSDARLAATLADAGGPTAHTYTWATVRVDRTKGLEWTLPSEARPPGARRLRTEATHATA